MVFFTPTNTEFKVNDATINTDTVTSPDVGVSSDGTSIVVWEEPFSSTDQDTNQNLMFRRFAPDGTPIEPIWDLFKEERERVRATS